MKVSKTLLCPSEFQRASEIISSKFIDNLGGQAPSETLASPALGYRLQPTNQDPGQNIKGAHKTSHTASDPVICVYILD